MVRSAVLAAVPSSSQLLQLTHYLHIKPITGMISTQQGHHSRTHDSRHEYLPTAPPSHFAAASLQARKQQQLQQ